MPERMINVYLSGEIHSNWRDEIATACEEKKIPVRLMGPETDHGTSDKVGKEILGSTGHDFWDDHQAAKINGIRNRSVMQNCDVVVVRFGEKYRQWNAAYDAGQAVAWGKSLITMHPEDFDHALKEVDSQAMAVTRNVNQVVQIFEHICRHPF